MFGHLVPKLRLVLLLIFVKLEIQAACCKFFLEMKQWFPVESCRELNLFQRD